MKQDVKIKFCGLHRYEDVEYANILMPDYVGFVFAKSKRKVSYEMAVQLRGLLNKQIQVVGVFVNENPEVIIALLQSGVIDLAQLHGTEGVEDVHQIQMKTKKKVIKGIRQEQFSQIKLYEESSCDFLLLDSGAGGGETFDWKLLPTIHKPFFLAGGITEENVELGIRTVKPYGIDVSSGIETDGKKDFTKMKSLIERIRRGESI